MALQVWLPLNGTLENNGLSKNTTVTNNGATVGSDGKIGSCYSFDGSSQYFEFSNLNIDSKSQLTMAFWCRSNVSDGTTGIFTVRNSGGSHQISLYNSRLYFRDSNHSTLTGIQFEQPTQNVWTHYAIVYDNGSWIFYKNGLQINRQTYSSATLNSGLSEIRIGRYQTSSGNAYYNGKLNDFRIYDHALSQKEISELSQALILHYPLDNVAALMSKCENITWNQLARPTNASQSTAKNVTYSRTDRKYLNIQTTQDGISGTGTQIISTNYLNENTIAGTDVFRQQSGHKYYSPNTLPDGFVFSINNYSYGISPYSGVIQTGVRPSNPSTIQYWSFKGNGGTVVPELVQCPLMIFDLTMMFGEGNEPTKEEFNMMFPYSYYPYDTGTVKNLKTPMPDCSGYKRDGTITGMLSLDSSTPRYSRSTSFDGTSYISVPTSVKVKDEITLSVWAYLDDWTTYCDTNSTNGRFISCTQTGGWTISAESGVIKFYMGTGTSSNTYKTANASTTLASLSSGWHLFTGTYDGFSSKIYIDGVLDGSTTAYSTKTPIYYHSTNSVFIGAEAGTSATVPNATTKLFNGKLSDIRIYATALSADKIKELYDTSAFVDNNQNLFCYEIVEDNSVTPQIDKTGMFHSPEFTESTAVEIYEDETKANQFIEI